uniref:Neur_chan_LBD domain-containing protein n=1 Tax=Heterorhabditis bacteriophora TaxID=37862 RepID=A0A1I7XU77_HETBA
MDGLFILLATGLTLSSCSSTPSQIKLVHDLLDKYDKKAKPMWDNSKPINVSFSMDLYQILELNEPQQYILLNAWIIERWYDEFLFWVPEDYQNITELRLPYDAIWLPDTTLYNSLVMKDDDTRRLLNAKLTTDRHRRASLIELLYPTIYKFSCLLDLRFFPFDVQLTLYLRRKPLFYLVNLIIPTSIITLIAIVGFFTTSSASGMREEKVSLGITTLLSMSILMLMVSDQMPTTSTFIPLIGWFILAMIVVISLGTIVSSVIIAIQKRGSLGERLSKNALRIAKAIAYITCTALPPHIEKEQMMEAFDLPTPTVEIKPIRPQTEASKKWMSLRRAKNGVAIVSDKSTDPLIHLSPSTTGMIFNDSCLEDVLTPGMTPFASLPPSATCEDDVSLGSEISSKPPTGRLPKQNYKGSATANAASIKHNRQLAVAEFEWLATVVERCCFVIFVLCFLTITVGINCIGFIHWYYAGFNLDNE